jgi:integrase
MLLLYTGMRRSECAGLTRDQIDLDKGLITIPMTKNGKPHSLPITPLMHQILHRRCEGLSASDKLFKGVSVEHLAEMAMRAGAPKFMLHDLRKLHASIGKAEDIPDSVLRRILNHTPPKSDTLHRHYVAIELAEVSAELVKIQTAVQSAN